MSAPGRRRRAAGSSLSRRSLGRRSLSRPGLGRRCLGRRAFRGGALGRRPAARLGRLRTRSPHRLAPSAGPLGARPRQVGQDLARTVAAGGARVVVAAFAHADIIAHTWPSPPRRTHRTSVKPRPGSRCSLVGHTLTASPLRAVRPIERPRKRTANRHFVHRARRLAGSLTGRIDTLGWDPRLSYRVGRGTARAPSSNPHPHAGSGRALSRTGPSDGNGSECL